MNETLLDEVAAGKYIGGTSPISTKTMQRWRLNGEGPAFIRVGRLIRYRQSDIDAWLASRTVRSTSAPAA